MPGPDQKIGTVLIPELGLDLSPEFIEQSIVKPDFSRVFAHLIAYSANRGILIRATSDGSLKVVSAGTPFEEYIVFKGTGGADFAAPNIKEYDVAYNVTDILVESFAAIISFRNLQGVWLDPKALPVGYHSIDFIHYGYQIKRRSILGDTDFEVTIYR
ncbi:MAG: hypothetical protein GH151_01920 [Bacteroidetes bacterium]|nr:hypothetical protein [Bacteroidota bacterium]